MNRLGAVRQNGPTTSESVLIEIRGLSVEYGAGPQAVRAVDRVDLVINRGEVIGLAGESGSGKSTLAHAVARILREPAIVTNGEVVYRGGVTSESPQPESLNVLKLTGEELRRFRWEEIAVVFQSAMNALNPIIDIRTQFIDTFRAHRPAMDRKSAEARAAELLEQVGISRDRLRSFPHQLSGGMRQRVIIAIALALEPKLLIMDEPTTALDVVTQRQILEQLAELRSQFGFAILFITHDLSLLLEVADRIAIMYAGRLVEQADGREFYARPAHPYSVGLLRSYPPVTGPRRELLGIPGSPPDLEALGPGCAFSPRCPHSSEVCHREAPPLTKLAVREGEASKAGHLVSCWLYAGIVGEGKQDAFLEGRGGTSLVAGEPSKSPRDEALIEASDLRKLYPVRTTRVRDLLSRQAVHAVDDVSFELKAGEVVAIVGESGSGKSTVARMLARLETASGGRVALRGQTDNSRRTRALRAYRHDVQLIFQDPYSSLNALHTVGYHLARPLRIHHITRSKRETRQAVLELLERVHLSPGLQFIDKYPSQLSGGQRQRVAIARALAAKPRVLLADEPVSMLDVSIRLSVLNLLLDIARNDEVALLYITHDIASARYFADVLLVMYAGRLVEGGPAEAVTQAPAHPYTQLLLLAAPDPDALRDRALTLDVRGEPPSMINPPEGCRFHPRCPYAMPICISQVPERTKVTGDHWAACWLLGREQS